MFNAVVTTMIRLWFGLTLIWLVIKVHCHWLLNC